MSLSLCLRAKKFKGYAMKNEICIHCFISGRVHGVWFRASTRDQAKRLDVKGWVRNLADGRVEVLACGEKKQIEQLQNWLKKGPPLAKVNDLTIEEWPWENHDDFEVR